MIILLDTSTPTCYLTLVDGDATYYYDWLAERQLAKGLLQYITEKLADHNKTIANVTGLAVMRGPGSFTGLRIGVTVCNTIAHFEHIPIVGTVGDSWKEQALDMLSRGENQWIVMPDYGRPARITAPRK